jgi:hypothetical protein
MNLLVSFLQIGSRVDAFAQRRSHLRAQRLLISSLLCFGRKWVTRMICTANREQLDWSADYKLFSRSPWQSQDLFKPVLEASLKYIPPEQPIVIAGDETKAKRGGNKVNRSRWLRDPLSPPFHVNFIKAIRFVQFSVLLPLHQRHGVAARAVPASFEPVNIPRKPRKKASAREKALYEKIRKSNSMCKQAVRQMQALREQYDRLGAARRLLLFVLDGGFCNRTIFRAKRERSRVLARCRKDAKLCSPANDPAHPQRLYDPEKFTPEEIRADKNIPWRKQRFFIGGKQRPVRFKERSEVLWQGGATHQRLRLIVIAPIPYRLSIHSRVHYRQPAFFLCDDLELKVQWLIQAAIDRWQIEVNHRDEKQHIGLQDPQVWNDNSVDRLPAFLVAAYSFLLLASLQAYGPKRTDEYIQPPKWQRRRSRPSCLDLLNQLRKEAFSHPELLEPLEIDLELESASHKAAA